MIKKNLVLTILHQYKFPVIEPFVRSWLKIRKEEDELIIFTSKETSFATRKILNLLKIRIILFSSQNPLAHIKNSNYLTKFSAIEIVNYRFLLFLDFLESNKECYNQVLISDIRDVIFQLNPFKNQSSNEIHFFLEDSTQTFSNSDINLKWIGNVLDESSILQVRDKIVSCAGTTTGSINYIISYLRYMESELLSSSNCSWGMDQAIHNKYVYFESFPGKVVHSNDSGFVLTLGACLNFQQDKNDDFVNSFGIKYKVIHQYDRRKDLLEFYKLKYSGPKIIQFIKKVFFKLMP